MKEKILHELIKSKQFSHILFPILDKHKKDIFLDYSELEIFNIIGDCNNNQYHPTMDDIEISVLSNTSQRKDILVEKFSKIKELDLNVDIDSMIEKTIDFIKNELTISASIDVVKGLDKGQDVKEHIRKIAEVNDITIRSNNVLSFDDADRVTEYKQTVIKTFYDIIDTMTDGGLNKGTLSMLIAMVGVGKTQFKIDAAVAGFLGGLNILIISGEMGIHEMYKRADSDILKTIGTDLEKFSVKDYKDIITAVRSEYNLTNDLKMISVKANSYSAIDLTNELKTFENIDGWIPDIIYFDSWNLMAPNNKRLDVSATHIYFSAVIKEFRDVAKIYEIPFFGSIHVAPGEVNNIMNGKDINQYCASEYKNACRDADFVCALKMIYKDSDYYYKDVECTKPIEETLKGIYKTVVKFNNCKTRFGRKTRQGDVMYLRSSPEYAEFKMITDDKNKIITNKIITESIEKSKRKKTLKQKMMTTRFDQLDTIINNECEDEEDYEVGMKFMKNNIMRDIDEDED